MGFPQHKICNQNEASICMCHMESAECKFSTGGYFCPVCNNKYCELPVECKICGNNYFNIKSLKLYYLMY